MEVMNVKFMAPSGRTSYHTIYYKKHSLRKNSSKTPNDRTLFTVGWPPFCTESDIEHFFFTQMEITVEKVYLRTSPGNIEEMIEDTNSDRRDFGYIVFKTIDDLKNATKAPSTRNVFICEIKSVGLPSWVKQYKSKRPSVSVLSSKAQKEIEKYDSKSEEERKRRKMLSEPDEEGWVTVAKKPNIEPESVQPKRKRKKQQTHLKLYPFQLRETQREKLAELRRKFEQDKKKVAEMRAQRKFKPF